MIKIGDKDLVPAILVDIGHIHANGGMIRLADDLVDQFKFFGGIAV